MLHFKERDSYSSRVGGIVSIILIILLSTYSIKTLIPVLFKNDYYLNENTKELYVYYRYKNFTLEDITENDSLDGVNQSNYYCHS